MLEIVSPLIVGNLSELWKNRHKNFFVMSTDIFAEIGPLIQNKNFINSSDVSLIKQFFFT